MKNTVIISKAREKGEIVRKLILNKLPNNIYHLSKQFKLNPSTIRYHLSILENKGLVSSTEIRKNNRIQLLYFLTNEETLNFLHLSSDLFNPKGKVYLYALTGSTFGVSTEPVEEWKKQSIWETSIEDFESFENKILIKVPPEMKNHYNVPFGILEPAFSTDKKTALFYVNIVK